jgi:hypothetical protein
MLAFLYDILIALLACPEYGWDGAVDALLACPEYGWDGAVDVCVHQNPELLEAEDGN